MKKFTIIGVCISVLICGCATQLEKAIDSGDLKAARIAIQQGADVSTTYYLSPIHEAVHESNLPMIQLLHANGGQLDQCYLDTDYPDFWNVNQSSYFHDSLPPLGSAIARNDLEIVAGLIELGAPIEQRCIIPMWPDYDFSAIMVAAEFGSTEVVNLLLDHGAMPNRLLDGHTPISIAAQRGHYETVRILLARGAYHSYSIDIKQPIERASDNGHEDVVNLLSYAGATRPRRKDPSKALENIADALVDGVILIGTIALIAEGSKYYGYESTYEPYIPSRDTVPSMMQTQEDSSCANDFECGSGQICIKKYAQTKGICVRDAGSRGKVGSSVNAGKGGDLSKIHFCDTGFQYSFVYGMCVQGVQ